jgi:hypothetical protein
LKEIRWSDKLLSNLAEHVFTKSEESVLKTGINFAIANPVFKLHMVFAAEIAW